LKNKQRIDRPVFEAEDMNWVILTGAGISAEFGIQTFRGADGLWEGHDIHAVATPMGWNRDPSLVWNFYTQRRRQLLDTKPNAAHLALAKLESALCTEEEVFMASVREVERKWLTCSLEHDATSIQDEAFILITQNVDDLHARAGSRRIIAMHGALATLRHPLDGRRLHTLEDQDLDSTRGLSVTLGSESIELIEVGDIDPEMLMRPDVVWFGEMPIGLDAIEYAIQSADVFVSIGTSGHVEPAASFGLAAKQAGAKTYWVNLEAPQMPFLWDEVHLGKAGEILPDLVDHWCEIIL